MQERLTLIQDETARWFNVHPSALRSRLRPEYVAWPRQVAMFLCVELCELSCWAVARHFDRTRWNVGHAVRRVHDRCDTEPATKRKIDELKEHLCRLTRSS